MMLQAFICFLLLNKTISRAINYQRNLNQDISNEFLKEPECYECFYNENHSLTIRHIQKIPTLPISQSDCCQNYIKTIKTSPLFKRTLDHGIKTEEPKCYECFYDENNSLTIQYTDKPPTFPISQSDCCQNYNPDKRSSGRELVPGNVATPATTATAINNLTNAVPLVGVIVSRIDNETQVTAFSEQGKKIDIGSNITNNITNSTNDRKNEVHEDLNDDNTTLADIKHDNQTIVQLIDLLRVFRLVQLKQLQRYLSESLTNSNYMNSNDENAAERFYAQHRDLSTIRNKSVAAIEAIFKAIVLNKSIQKLWCDKQRDLKGENCSLAELWKLFNMTLKPINKANFAMESGGFKSQPVLSNLTTSQFIARALNETMAGNITLELTVRMDGKKVGNVEMLKSYYERAGKLVATPGQAEPYKLLVYSDLGQNLLANGIISNLMKNEKDLKIENNTVTASNIPSLNKTENQIKHWSDPNIKDNTTTFYDEILDLDHPVASDNIFDDESSGWDLLDALYNNASYMTHNNSSNSSFFILLPQPIKANFSSNSSIRLHGSNNMSKSINMSNVQFMPTNSTLKKILKVRASDLYTRNIASNSADDKSEYIATLSELFRLLLSNHTMKNVKSTSSSLNSQSLREKYFNNVIDMLQTLKQTLTQLQLPHDNTTEDTLVSSLKQLLNMVNLIDKHYLLPAIQTDNGVKHSTVGNETSFSPRLGQSSRPAIKGSQNYGDLGEEVLKKRTKNKGEKHISVDELKQLLPNL